MVSERVSTHRLRVVVLALLAVLLPACYDGNVTPFRDAVVIGQQQITGISVTAGASIIEVGTTLQVTATGTTPGGTTNLNGSVTWSSSNPAAVSVDGNGLVTGVANGTATITATLGQYSASVAVTASNATLQSIAVSGPAGVDVCNTGTYTASGNYSDSTTRDITTLVTWSLTDSSVARMSTRAVDANLLITKLAGTTGVVATRNGVVSPALPVTIANDLTAIAMAPHSPTQMKSGQTQAFTATGTWGTTTADISRAATWSVTNTDTTAPAIATVLNGDVSPGQVTAASGGTGTLTAACGGLNDNVGLTVVYLSSLAITNTQPITLATGKTVLLVLQGTYSDGSTASLNESATWSASVVTGTVVTVSNTTGTHGLVTAGSATGVSTVTATVGGKQASVTVSVQ